MGEKLRYTFRIRPGKVAESHLVQESHRARFIYNTAVAQLKKDGTWMKDKSITSLRQKVQWLKSGSVVVQQQSLRDFSQAKGRRKFKSKRTTLPSINYTKRGFSLVERVGNNGETVTRLKIAGGFIIPVLWSRELPSAPTSVRIFQDSIGHWYASFVVECEKSTSPKTGNSIGIDWGIKTLATTTDDNYDLEQPRFSRKAQAQLARAQKELARRKKGSRHRQQSKKRVATLHKKVARQRKDLAHKWSRSIVDNFDNIAIEDFASAFLFASPMARCAGDGAIGMLKTILSSKAHMNSRNVVLVNPAYTTMTCSQCGTKAKRRLELSERTFDCQSCEFHTDRDKNAARVVLARAGFNPVTVENVSPDVPTGALAV